MSKSKELGNMKIMVNEILQMDKKSRNSDSYLYSVVCEIMAKKKGIDLSNISAKEFLANQKEMGMPNYETVRRTRQKVQENDKSLAADDNVQAMREMNQEAFEEFVRR